ncbi:hypothetical protein [Halorussus caseinilyticus]|uniref:Uncharacterized protein n=1 Tax=Halorussus caseinilyticus TaxID=3034025 RepID=A0ABD5WHE2_9EURY|nr:hypothetical protein [Halorussus sp. DT72]
MKHDPKFEELIAANEMPDARIKVRINDEYLLGDEDHYVESIMIGLTLVDLLEAAENVVSGTRGSVELLDSGTYLVLEPEDQRRVTISKCFSPSAVSNPSERLFDPCMATRGAVISEIIRVAEEWRNDALEVNPDITATKWFKNLQESVDSLNDEFQDR